MVTLAKSGWAGPQQAALTSAADQAVQYRQIAFALKQELVATGWTVERASNGVSVAASDNWATVADVVYGTEASEAHSWISLAAPAGKGNPSGGSNYRILINCNNSAADTTPQNVDLYVARGTYGGGSTTTRPTITGVETTALARNIVPWSSPVAGSLCLWSTDDGDVYLGVKANGDTFFRMFLCIRDDLVDGIGNYLLTLFCFSSTTVDVVTATNLVNAANWRGFTAAGANLTTIDADSMAWSSNIASSWTGGAEGSSGRVLQRDVEIASNAASGRHFGFLVDVRGVPQNAGWMFGDINDDGNALPFQLLTIGDLMIPCDSDVT